VASVPLDSLGRRRSPAAVQGYLAGRPSRNRGRRYPPDPPRTEEIIAVMRCCGDDVHGARARGLIAVLWRAGLRIQEALDLNELDLDRRRGSVLVRRGKGGRRREVGMDDWGFEQLEPWLREREQTPIGPLFCVIDGRTRGRAWYASAARAALRRRAARAGGGVSLHISCGTRTPSSLRARACRSTSSNASSGTATSASRRSISKASTQTR
jgi:integrase